MLVAEGHRFQRQDRFACPVHRLDSMLIAFRGDDRAEFPVRADDGSYATRHRHSADASDKSSLLYAGRADPDFVGFARDTRVPNVDVVLASGEISTGRNTQCDVEAAGSVAKERTITDRNIVGADCVANGGIKTAGCVVTAGSVAIERLVTQWPCC